MDLRKMLASGHALVVALGLLFSAAMLVRGVQDTTDEGAFSWQDSSPPVQNAPPRERIRNWDRNFYFNSSVQERSPVRNGAPDLKA